MTLLQFHAAVYDRLHELLDPDDYDDIAVHVRLGVRDYNGEDTYNADICLQSLLGTATLNFWVEVNETLVGAMERFEKRIRPKLVESHD